MIVSKYSTIYSRSRARKLKEMSEVTSCALTHGHVQVRKYPRHIYLLTVTCNKINELTRSVCNRNNQYSQCIEDLRDPEGSQSGSGRPGKQSHQDKGPTACAS